MKKIYIHSIEATNFFARFHIVPHSYATSFSHVKLTSFSTAKENTFDTKRITYSEST